MTESKLITLLRTLDEEEMRKFGKFLEGTAQRKSPDRIAFFNYLKKYHPEFPVKKTEREYVAQKLFAKDANRIKKIENLMHTIGSVLEDFLLYEELKAQQTQRDFLLLEIYKKRKLDKFFFKKIEQIEKSWEKEKPAGIEQLHNEYLIKKMCFTHPNYSIISDASITQDDLIYRIDKHYFAVKLYWTLCAIVSKSFVATSDKETLRKQHFIQKILDTSLQTEFQNTPQIKLLSEMCRAFMNNDFQNYSQMKSLFMSHLDIYDQYEKYDILLLFLTTICYENHRQGKEESMRELFEINKYATENGFIFENGSIPHVNFRNIVYIACAAEELDWAEHFVDNYGRFLGEEDADNIVILCKALVSFSRGDYDVVLDKLARAKFQDVFYNAQVRSVLLQCYYELDDELFFGSVDAFRNFLGRNKALASNTKKAFSNFIHFTKKLKKAEHEFRPDVKHLLDEIANTNNVVNKTWLISKVEILRHN